MMSRSDWTNQPNHIRRFRKQRNLRMRDVARLLGTREAAHISQWESGQRLPTLENALKISVALDCPIELLFRNHYQMMRDDMQARRERFNIPRI